MVRFDQINNIMNYDPGYTCHDFTIVYLRIKDKNFFFLYIVQFTFEFDNYLIINYLTLGTHIMNPIILLCFLVFSCNALTYRTILDLYVSLLYYLLPNQIIHFTFHIM